MLQNLPLELTEAVLDYLEDCDLRRTLRTARFLRYPSERRLYYTVSLLIGPKGGQGGRQARFLNTVFNNHRLAQYVIVLVMGGCSPADEGDPRVNAIIGQAMKKMVNLKDLSIAGGPYILNAQLDSVPFSLTRLLFSGGIFSDKDFPSFLPILRAHPKLEELAFESSTLPSDLIAALKTEGEVPGSEILCPHLKRFDGYDDGLRLFLARRRIERGTTMGSGDELIKYEDLAAVWLTPTLTSSYRHLRVLEVWITYRPTRNACLLPTIAPYLTSLTHLLLVDNFSCMHPGDPVISSLGKMRALESFTLSDMEVTFSAAVLDPQATSIVGLVRVVCPDIAEIFVGGYSEPPVFHHYTKGRGLHSSAVSEEVACRPYTKWVREPTI